MAKATRISLQKEDAWIKKGDAVDRFGVMLARCQNGSRISDTTDQSNLAALLEFYHSVLAAGHPTKAGSGVSHFERCKHQDHHGNASGF